MTSTLGIDVGGSSIKWALMDDRTPVDTGSLPTPQQGADSVLHAIAGLIRSHEHHLDPQTAVGVALPASLDADTSEILALPNIPGTWSGIRPSALLEHHTGHRVDVLNDARAFAAGQLVVGAAREVSDALLVALGTGVGGALILDRTMWLGTHGLVGELGHLVVDPNGRPCGCGQRGCLEAYCGAAGLVTEATRRGIVPRVRDASARDLFVMAACGDIDAQQLIAEAGAALGTAIGLLSTFLVPEVVIIGGGLAEGLPQLRSSITASLAETIRIVNPPPVVASTSGPHGGAIGAAAWAAGLVPVSPAPSERATATAEPALG